jgi:hypothetical protein
VVTATNATRKGVEQHVRLLPERAREQMLTPCDAIRHGSMSTVGRRAAIAPMLMDEPLAAVV